MGWGVKSESLGGSTQSLAIFEKSTQHPKRSHKNQHISPKKSDLQTLTQQRGSLGQNARSRNRSGRDSRIKGSSLPAIPRTSPQEARITPSSPAFQRLETRLETGPGQVILTWQSMSSHFRYSDSSNDWQCPGLFIYQLPNCLRLLELSD